MSRSKLKRDAAAFAWAFGDLTLNTALMVAGATFYGAAWVVGAGLRLRREFVK